MIGKFLNSGLLLPTVLTIVGLGVLVSLGNWQLARKVEKDQLVAEISQRTDAAPVALLSVDDVKAWQARDGGEYTNVRLRGRFDPGLERHLYVAHKTLGPGFDVYAPLRVSETDVVWVNRGYLERRLNTAWKRMAVNGRDEVEILGRVRFPGVAGTFTPENNVSKNEWYWRDIQAMHESAYPDGDVRSFPFYVEASESPDGADGLLKPGVSRVSVFNRHFEYALTWYGLALTLLGVFVAFAWGRLRQA